MSVDEFMSSHGFFSAVGYLSPEQKKQFIDRFSLYPNLKAVAEIGFNAGHSAECFLENCSQLEGIVSFDLGIFPYSKPAAEFLEKRYPNQFLYVEGDSLDTVPKFNELFPKQKFDLIYIDGNHLLEFAFTDIQNMRALSHPETLLWIDDVFYPSVKGAVHFAEITGLIQIEQIFSSETRSWIEARYTYS